MLEGVEKELSKKIRNMKKFISFLSLLCCSLSFASCAKTEDRTENLPNNVFYAFQEDLQFPVHSYVAHNVVERNNILLTDKQKKKYDSSFFKKYDLVFYEFLYDDNESDINIYNCKRSEDKILLSVSLRSPVNSKSNPQYPLYRKFLYAKVTKSTENIEEKVGILVINLEYSNFYLSNYYYCMTGPGELL